MFSVKGYGKHDKSFRCFQFSVFKTFVNCSIKSLLSSIPLMIVDSAVLDVGPFLNSTLVDIH